MRMPAKRFRRKNSFRDYRGALSCLWLLCRYLSAASLRSRKRFSGMFVAYLAAVR